MGRLRSGWLAAATASIVGAAAFGGCSAEGETIGEPFTEPAPAEPPASSLPASGSSEDGPGPADASSTKRDSGRRTDAAVDAGSLPPVPGEPCATPNSIVEKPCGACGRHSAVCLVGDGGAGHWSDYGSCDGQVPGGCEPGQTVTEACGNCGTRVRTCSKSCGWDAPKCAGEPSQSCSPGTVDLVAAGCKESTYRQVSCRADCTYEPVSVACDAPPTFVTVPPTTGGVSSTIALLSASQTMTKVTGACPATLSAIITPYAYVQVKNPLPKGAVVSIWSSTAPHGAVVDTTLAAYASETGPTSDTPRRSCVQLSAYGNSSLTGDDRFASLDGSRKLTIAAGGTISVYVGAEKGFDASKPSDSTGPVKLNVRTESLSP